MCNVDAWQYQLAGVQTHKAMSRQHILLIRFSALGDILMTVPVVNALARQYPDVEITMVSRPFVGSIFAHLPGNVHFLGINPRQYPGGLPGIFRRLRQLHPTHVCDLHDVLRTKFLRAGFWLTGHPVSHIVKDRKARRDFITQQPKRQQPTSFRRYAEALARIGFSVDLQDVQPLFTSARKDGIGIAPFAAHRGKIYPLEDMEKVVAALSGMGRKVYLFGAGQQEKSVTESWAAKYPGVESMVGRLEDMAAEAAFMASLEVMLTMDSGNMHLASLTDTPVVSIWGATHPLGGFLGWGQGMRNVLQADMPCRPCSTFGNKPCTQGDYPCLRSITTETIVNKVLKLCK